VNWLTAKISNGSVLLHSSSAQHGAGFQQHYKKGTLREWTAKTDFFASFFEYRLS